MISQWYKADAAWRFRAPLSTPGQPGGPVDGLLTLDATAQHVFKEARDNGFDLRFTGPDGVTELPYERVAWNAVAMTATIHLQGVAAVAAACGCLYVYYGNAVAGDASQALGLTPTQAVYLDPAQPGSQRVSGNQRSSAVVSPRARFSMGVLDEVDVCWRLSDLLAGGAQSVGPGGSPQGVTAVSLIPYSGNPVVPKPALVDIADFRFVQDAQGALWARTRIKGDGNAASYVLPLLVTTTDGRTVTRYAAITLYLPVEPQ